MKRDLNHRYYCAHYFFRFISNSTYEYHFLIYHCSQLTPWMLWTGQHADKAARLSVPHCHRRTSCWWCPNFILMSLWRASTRYNEALPQTEAAISVITVDQLFRMTFAYDSFEFCDSLLQSITRLFTVFQNQLWCVVPIPNEWGTVVVSSSKFKDKPY